MASILIVYGTTGGNTELTAEKVCEVLAEKGHQARVLRCEHAHPQDLKDPDVVILAAPTYGHGILHEPMEAFIKAVQKAKIDLKQKPVAVIGLGDPRYETQYHIESAAILEKALKDLNGKIIAPALRISKSPVWHLNGYITVWAKQLADKI